MMQCVEKVADSTIEHRCYMIGFAGLSVCPNSLSHSFCFNVWFS